MFDFLEVHLSDKLCVKFHNVAVKNKSCTVRLLAKFEIPAQPSNKTCLDCLNEMWQSTSNLNVNWDGNLY